MTRDERPTHARDDAEAQRFLFDGLHGEPCGNGDPRRPTKKRRSRAATGNESMNAGDDRLTSTAIAAAMERLTVRLEARLAALERAVMQWRDEIHVQRTVKEFYTTAEVAQILGRRPYTVREWCRLGRIHADKAHAGRGLDEEWRVGHDELVRIQNEGLLAIEKFSQVAAPKRLPK